jgi:hypothetical protein
VLRPLWVGFFIGEERSPHAGGESYPSGVDPSEVNARDLLDANFFQSAEFKESGGNLPPLGLGGGFANGLRVGGEAQRWLCGLFEIHELLGQGGMGAVFRARERSSGRDVALKLVKTPKAKTLLRFQREAELLAKLRHPGIVSLHTSDQRHGCAYMTCELVVGAKPLDVAWKGCGPERRVGWILEAADAIGFAHRQGVIHRDIKPANLLVEADGRLRVIDFGLATHAEVERLTLSGTVMGTPTHFAPEQAVGERGAVSAATDVWALGVCLYQALTNELPFVADSMAILAARIVGGEPQRPRKLARDVTPALEAVCLKALSKDPTDRYSDGDAFARALRAALTERPPAWRRAGVLAGGAMVLAAAVGLGLASALSGSPPIAQEGADPKLATPRASTPTHASVTTTASGQARVSGAEWRARARLMAEGNESLSRQRAAWGRAIEADPGFAHAYTQRGLVCVKEGDFASAIRDYDAALARYDPQDVNRRWTRSWRKIALRSLAESKR